MLSIIIPALNEEALLPLCLEAIQRQVGAEPFEVIVVDNGSTDRTAEIAKAWGAVVVRCPQRGAAFARQRGLLAAKGDIVIQIDADTVVPPGMIQRFRSWFDDPSVVAVAGDAKYQPGTLGSRAMRLLYRAVNTLSVRFVGRPATMLAGALAVRRTALLAGGGFDLTLPHSGDERGVVSKLSKLGRVVYDPQLVVESSDRRFRGRFLRFLVGDWLLRTGVDGIVHSVTGKSPFGARPVVRAAAKVPAHGRTWGLRGVLAVFLALLAVGAYGAFIPSAQVFGHTFTRGDPTRPVVALTFDDGPNEPYTSQVLDVLAKEGVKATFFVVGQNAQRHPEVLQRMLQEGHVIGNHSYSHPLLAGFTPGICSEIRRGEQAVEQIVGLRPRLFRPPYGIKTPPGARCVAQRGLVTVMWGAESGDPSRPPAELIVQRTLDKVGPGAIILLHDGNTTRDGSDRSATVRALFPIIERLRARGYSFVTVPELLGIAPYLNTPGASRGSGP